MLRKQITDCLRWIKHNKDYGYWVMRAEVEENLDSMDVTHTALSLKALLNFIEQQGYTDIFISASSYRDYDDYDGYKIELYTHRKQTQRKYPGVLVVVGGHTHVPEPIRQYNYFCYRYWSVL